MFIAETEVRVRYSETDRMGYVYYGNYPTYYEVGRVEALRAIGLSYREMEDRGFMLPVRDLQIRYIRPAFYDEQIIIKTCIPELPNTRIRFDYELFNASGELINTGSTVLVFVHVETQKPCMAPPFFLDLIKPFFNAHT